MRIVYNSFHGRYSDNPRALFERLRNDRSNDHVWLADRRHSDGFPPDVTVVDIDSPAASRALASADLVIANTHVEVDWQKSSGTFYLQTWHGTPWKRIHRDVRWAPPGRLDRLDEDVAQWDLLLSPNPVSTPRLRQAFRHTGPVVETGYPRNDLLSSPLAGARRRRVRAELGLERGTTAVLYAPTWRDHESFEGGDELRLGLDPAALAAALGDTFVVLVRAHNMVTGRFPVPSGPQVRDVSHYPDICELYLAADALVTDYSSAMFDFAITGKPMAFFTYDLDDYRDVARGFYFDLEDIAPGPVLRTFDDLVPALRSSLTDGPGSARYDAFRRTFCHLEDGHSGDRVIETLHRAVVAAPQLSAG